MPVSRSRAELRFAHDIETAFGRYARSDENPQGGTGSFDLKSLKPYRVHFPPGWPNVHGYATPLAAIDAARQCREELEEREGRPPQYVVDSEKQRGTP
jgi:hypothetical protein